MIKVIYNKACGRCVQSEPLTSGMVGQKIHFEYSHDFDGLAATAVFTDGKNTVNVVNPGNECIIPHEVLTTVGAMVKVGIYAVRGDELVIPTIYATIGFVLKGADPSGGISEDPTSPVWAQTQAMIGNLNALETEAKENLVLAINEVKQTTDGKQDTINDLEAIRAGAAKGATALQSVPNSYRTAAAQDVIDSGKQDKLIAGENITIAADGKTISATGGSSVPKPLTYDYMPEGYPKKTVQTVTLMEEQEVTFSDMGGGAYGAAAPVKIDISDGQTYTIVWDGVEYSCVGHVADGVSYIGNPAAFGAESTGEPFLYAISNQKNMWISYDTSTSHTIKVTIIDTVYQTIDVNMLPKAGEDYGVVKKDEIVTAYNFPAKAPHDQMVDAISAFKTGNASIVWSGKKVINAYYNSSDDTISVSFAKEPLRRLTFSKNSDGFYNSNLGSSTYEELQGRQVRIVNDNDATAVLMLEGIPSSTTLSVDVQKFSVLGGEFSGRALILFSSTHGSDKKFKITVDDSGVPSFTNTEDSTEVWTPADVPTKTSELENDAGYLTLATLPKYEGVVE